MYANLEAYLKRIEVRLCSEVLPDINMASPRWTHVIHGAPESLGCRKRRSPGDV